MTSLYKSHNAFILICAKLCGSLQKTSRPTTGPWPTVENHCSKLFRLQQTHPKRYERIWYTEQNTKVS